MSTIKYQTLILKQLQTVFFKLRYLKEQYQFELSYKVISINP